MGGELVQRTLDPRLVGQGGTRPRSDPPQERAAEPVGRQNAVQVAAHHPPVGAHRPIRGGAVAKHRPRQPRPRRAPHVDLVAAHGLARAHLAPRPHGQHLGRLQHRLDLQQPQPVRPAGATFQPERILDPLPQHLIAAAQPQHGAAPPYMGLDVDIPPFRPQGGKVAQRRLAARQHHQIGVAGKRLARLQHAQIDVGLGRERVEIVEIGEPRQPRHCHPDRPPHLARARPPRARPSPGCPPWADRAPAPARSPPPAGAGPCAPRSMGARRRTAPGRPGTC